MERFSHSRTISVRYKNYFKSLNKQRVMVNSTIFINRHPKITIHKTKQPTAFFFKWLAECDCMYNQGQANQFYQSDSRIEHHWTVFSEHLHQQSKAYQLIILPHRITLFQNEKRNVSLVLRGPGEGVKYQLFLRIPQILEGKKPKTRNSQRARFWNKCIYQLL